MTPDEYCQKKAAASGSSFYYSFRFLQARQRQAITALYAFCREVDDIVDNGNDEGVTRVKLQWWHDEIDRLYQNTPTHPVARALENARSHFILKEHLFHKIIIGMEMDLSQHRYQSFEQLQRYCYHAASVVGLLSINIFGFKNEQTLKYAHDLGLALQLINIIRDVGEDAGRGRIYLPLEDLAAHQVSEQDILKGRSSPPFISLMDFQAQRALSFYCSAMEFLPAEDRYQQRTGIVMGEIYCKLLQKIKQKQFKVLNKRTSLTPIYKLWIAWNVIRKEKQLHLASTDSRHR